MLHTQAVAVSYAKQAVKLMVSLVMAGKELNTQKMGASLIHKTVTFRDMLLWQHRPHWWLLSKLIKDDGHDQSDVPSLSGTRISDHQVTCWYFTQICFSEVLSSCTTEESSPRQLQNLAPFQSFPCQLGHSLCLFLHSINNVIVLKSFGSADECNKLKIMCLYLKDHILRYWEKVWLCWICCLSFNII